MDLHILPVHPLGFTVFQSPLYPQIPPLKAPFTYLLWPKSSMPLRTQHHLSLLWAWVWGRYLFIPYYCFPTTVLTSFSFFFSSFEELYWIIIFHSTILQTSTILLDTFPYSLKIRIHPLLLFRWLHVVRHCNHSLPSNLSFSPLSPLVTLTGKTWTVLCLLWSCSWCN